jgi:hypothetical protein
MLRRVLTSLKKDYNFAQDDVIQVSKVGFGTTKISDFSYDTSSGNLPFLGNQFASLENLPCEYSIGIKLLRVPSPRQIKVFCSLLPG